MSGYINWEYTAIGLSALTLGSYWLLRRPLGVSGSWARVVLWHQDREIREAEKPFHDKPTMLMDALMAATIEEFGRDMVEQAMEKRRGQKVELVDSAKAAAVLPSREPWTSHLVFLMMLVVGGYLSTYMLGGFTLTYSLGEEHQHYFGSGFSYIITLLMGGVMVGFGTQLAGGCTSGHGLSGVSRLMPASIIATASFFGAAVFITKLLHFLEG